ncbi:MAG TPA: hypothetical protein VLC72_03220 [Nitrosopumilaceae archaeon]|nr:hypothetical protein [Nitrosopumilaceae archaeon]
MSKNNGSKNTREYRKAFGQFSSMETQRVASLDPAVISLDPQEDVNGGVHSIDFDGGNIMIKQSGTYLIIGAPQVSKTEGARNRWIDFWLRVNNVDLSNSNVRRVLTNKDEKDVIPLNAVTSLNKGDIVQLMMAAETSDEGIGIECIEPEGEPGIPSVIITIVQLD